MTNIAPVDIQDLSLLSPNKFQVVINAFGEVAFWAQEVELPDIAMGVSKQNTNTNLNWNQPGDKIEYDPLVISFPIDENMIAYRKLKQWMHEITSHENVESRFSDLSIIVLTNNSNANLSFVFRDAFPSKMSGPTLSTEQSEDSPILCRVVFEFVTFDILPDIGNVIDSNS